MFLLLSYNRLLLSYMLLLCE